MSVATQTLPAVAAPPARELYRLTVDQYHRMTQTGVLTAIDRVELLEGLLVAKVPHNPPHDGTLARLNRKLIRLLPDQWVVRVQSAITLSSSEPESDLAIVTGPDEIYFERHPTPQDVALLIEVADSSLLTDRRDKGRLYAAAKIVTFWIINLAAAQVEVYSRPKAGKSPDYRQRQTYGKDDTIPLILAGQEIAHLPIRQLLP
jgi:hypothetical protein